MKMLTVEQRLNRNTWFISGILSALLVAFVYQEPGPLAATVLVEMAVAWLLYSVMLWPAGLIVMCVGITFGIQPRQ